MPSQHSLAPALRRFTGVDVSHDSAFLRPDQLVKADNWVPDRTWLLRKRFGTAAYLSDTSATGSAQALRRFYRANGDRIFYYVGTFATPDAIRFSTNDGAFGVVTGGVFAASGSVYGSTQVKQNVYFGNGVDDMKRIDVDVAPGTAVDLAALTSFTDDSTFVAVAMTAGSNKDLVVGTYSLAWAIYNSSTKLWIKRSTARLQNITSDAQVFSLTVAPTAALSANELYHLFIAPVNLPIEFAHDHTPDGMAAGALGTARRINEIVTNSTPIPISSAVTRKGRFLVSHLSRLWLAGDQGSRRRVSASNVILGGNEQALFDQGEFFPVNATLRLDDDITGLGVATIGETTELPSAPLAIFTRASTYLLQGDILDDPSAALFQVSNRIGCISHHTIVATPLGLMFVGNESVYLLRPDVAQPVDIGMAITRAIREIPEGQRVNACAIYHKGFYKLSIAVPGGATNTTQWWLDIRDGTAGLAWWGPHSHVAISAMANGARESVENDRGYGALQGSTDAEIVLLDQENVFTDNGATVKSILQTPSLDFQAPFQRKIFTRMRVNGRAAQPETLSAVVVTDDGVSVTADPLVINGTLGAAWGVGEWDAAQWGSVFFAEAESVFPADRPRGVSISAMLTHNDARKVEIRDLDVHYTPITRVVE